MKEKKITHHFEVARVTFVQSIFLSRRETNCFKCLTNGSRIWRYGLMFAYIQCRLNLFENRPKLSNRKPQSTVEIRLEVDISHNVIENYDWTLYLRSSHTKTLHLSLGSKKRTTNILDANILNWFQVEVSGEVKKIRKIVPVLVRSRTCKWLDFFACIFSDNCFVYFQPNYRHEFYWKY